MKGRPVDVVADHFRAKATNPRATRSHEPVAPVTTIRLQDGTVVPLSSWVEPVMRQRGKTMANRLYVIDDGERHWASAPNAERALELFYKAWGAWPADDDEPKPDVTEVPEEKAKSMRFQCDDGESISLWNAFTIMREHEGMIASTCV